MWWLGGGQNLRTKRSTGKRGRRHTERNGRDYQELQIEAIGSGRTSQGQLIIRRVIGWLGRRLKLIAGM